MLRRELVAARREALRERGPWPGVRHEEPRAEAQRADQPHALSGVEQPQMQRLGRRAARGHGEASRGADVRLLIFEAHLTGERGEVGHQLLILEAARRRRGRVRLRICLWFRFRLWLMLGIWRLRLGRAPQGGVQPAVDVGVEQRPRRRRRDRIVERFALPALWRFGGRCIARARFPDRPVLAYARKSSTASRLSRRDGARRRRRRWRGRALVKQ